jgi:hypothetical protein
MSKSSEPPILAKSEAARNCLGLNATVLPGLGTFRMGNHFRGLCEMAVALGGTVYFCITLLQAVGSRDEDIKLLQAFRPYFSHLVLGVALILGSWVSGFMFGKRLLQK